MKIQRKSRSFPGERTWISTQVIDADGSGTLKVSELVQGTTGSKTPRWEIVHWLGIMFQVHIYSSQKEAEKERTILKQRLFKTCSIFFGGCHGCLSQLSKCLK